MGFDPTVTTHEFLGAEDRRWLGHRLGADANRTVTIRPSLFVAAHVADKGGLPSGILLAPVTIGADIGRWGPYDPAAAADGRDLVDDLLFLFNTTKIGSGSGLDLATAPDVGVAGFWGPGIVKANFLPLFAGTVAGELDALARAGDGLRHIRFEG